MKLKALMLLVLAVLLALPSTALAAKKWITGTDLRSATWYGTYADNYVDGTVTLGTNNDPYDFVVNSVYLLFDNYNGVEIGWTKDRYSNGTYKGPYVFTVKKWNGVLTTQELGLCSNNTWYRWRIQSPSKYGDDFDIYFNTTYKWTWYDTGFRYGYAHTGMERWQDVARVDTHFKNLAKMGSDYRWYLWESISFAQDDPYYDPWGSRTEWWTLVQ
ncbi:MAG: hypothetical protein QME41_08875 [Actinomycetota bacterium]|nr:hypothetical protein [Actinomycetota bacterium]